MTKTTTRIFPTARKPHGHKGRAWPRRFPARCFGGYKATAGAPLAGAAGPADGDIVEAALKTVHDPEIPVNIYDLGLIYDVDRKDGGDVYITMSLTAPGCPVAGEMPGQVAEAVAAAEGVGEVTVELVWDPAWTPDRMSEDAKLALDLGF